MPCKSEGPSRTAPRCAAAGRMLIVSQLLLIPTKLLPGDVARMPVQQDNGPVFLLHSARVPFDARFFAWQGVPTRLRPPVDVGSGVQRTVQHIQHPTVAQANPLQLTRASSAPLPRGKAQLMRGEVTDHRQRRAGLLEEREHQADGFGNGFIRIQHHPAHRIIDQAAGQAKTQLSLFRFGQLAALQSLMQPVQFGLAHRSFEAQQQAVVVQAGIVDGLFVDDQGIGERTDLQQAIPITARAGQARDFQAQNGSDVAESDFSHQPLKPVASNGSGAGLALILVNDLDASWFPSQLLGALDQVILAG